MKTIYKYIVLLLLIFNTLFANGIENMLTTVVSQTNDKTVVRLDKKILDDFTKIDKLSIHINEKQTVTFRKKRVKKRLNGSIRWKGVSEKNNAQLLLTYFNDILIGQIRIEADTYKIWQKKDTPYYIIEREDTTRQNIFKEPIFSKPFKSRALSKKAKKKTDVQLSKSNSSINKEDLNIIDGKLQLNVIILYTKEFTDYHKTATSTRIQYLTDMANEVFENSKLDIELNVVHSSLFNDSSTNENNSISTAITQMNSNQKIKQLKRKYKAHFISLLRRYHQSGPCGIGYTPSGLGSLTTSSFTVVEDRQITEGSGYYCSDHTFIHEIGHNFGCNHNRENAHGNGIFPYSYGYYKKEIFATVMSYKSPSILYFSNPNITYKGYKIGVKEGESNSADNTKTINQTKYHIAKQFVEKLEATDSISGQKISGVLSDTKDRDAYKVKLDGNVEFSNLKDFFINIYDKDEKYLITGGGYKSLTYEFKKSNYTIVVSNQNDSSTSYFDGINTNYNIAIQGNISSATTQKDTDKDGISDEDEIKQGTDPTNPYSKIFTINLNSGWNLVSLELNSNLNLSDLNNEYIQTIKSLQNNTWKTWSKNSSSNTLTSLEDGYAYWIKATQNTSITFEGNAKADKQTIVKNKWNMIGSLSIDNIDNFFEANSNVKIIWKYKDGKYLAVSNDETILDELKTKNIERITEIKPNEGLFVK